MAESAADFEPPDRAEPRSPQARRASESGTAGVARRAEPTAPFRLYKPGQGTHVRWGTAAGAGVIALAASAFVYEQLGRFTWGEVLWVRTLVPLALLVGLVLLIFRLVGQHRGVVDFLIATEAEMKKVNWSTRREVLGATKVVIFTVLALGLIMFLVDAVFIWFFWAIGVLRIGDIWTALGLKGGQ